MTSYKRKQVVGDPECERVSIQGTINPTLKNNPPLEKRESLRITLRRPGKKTVTVIMMNPAQADSKQSDPTVNKVINYFYRQPVSVENVVMDDGQIRRIKDITYLNVVNLFPIYNPRSEKLYEIIAQICSQASYQALTDIIKSNHIVINNYLANSHYIVLAWGSCPKKFHEPLFYYRSMEVLRSIISMGKKDIFVFDVKISRQKTQAYLSRFGNPIHPSNGKLLNLVKVNLDEYKGILI